MADGIGKLAYDEAVRSIESQAGALDKLRGHAGTLLGAASLVTSFLGGQVLATPVLTGGTLSRADVGTPGWVGIGAFVLLAVLSVWILLPREWRFEMSAAKILNATGATDIQPDAVYAQLARFHDANRVLNRAKLNRLYWTFKVTCALLVVETVAWIVDVGDVDIPYVLGS